MKILFIAQRFHTNQVPIVEGLLADGHEVEYFGQMVGTVEDHSIIVPKKIELSFLGKLVSAYLKKKCDAPTYESKMVTHFLPKYSWLKKEISRFNPDVVILRYRIPTCLLANRICKKLGIRSVILYNQTGLYTKKDKKESLKKRIIFSFFPKVRATTTHAADIYELKRHMEDHYIKEHDYFLPYMCKLNPDAADRSYFKNGKLNILDVGKYRPYKNHFVLVNAVKLLKERNELDNIAFTILGQASGAEEQDYFNRLQKQIDDNELGEYITLRTHIPFSEMPKLYLDNDVFILTSLEEQASITILEVMSNGLVPISTNCNGTACYINEGVDGFFFQTNDPADLAERIKYISDNRNMVPEWGKNGYESIRCNYSYENFKQSLFDILKKEFGVTL